MLNLFKKLFKPSEEELFKQKVEDNYYSLVADFPFTEMEIHVDNWVNPPGHLKNQGRKVNLYKSFIIKKGLFGDVAIVTPLPNCQYRNFFNWNDTLDDYIRKDKMFPDFTDAYISAVNKRLKEIRK